jgi:hypothetical protein
MTDDDGLLYDEDGRRVGHLAPDEWSVPSDVELVDGWLVPIDFETLELRMVNRRPPPKPDARMLRRFADLADEPDAAIIEYARAWGMLGLCAHGLGRFHAPAVGEPWDPRGAEGSCREPLDLFAARTSGWRLGRRRWYFFAERLEDWRVASRQVGDVLARIAANAPASFHDWHRVTTPEVPPDRPDLGGSAFQWADRGAMRWWWQCGAYITRLVSDAGVRPTIEWTEPESGATLDDMMPRPRVVLGAGSLLGALAVQVLYAAAGGGGDVIRCDGCRQWYAPRRRSSGRRSWCPACRENGTANRHYAELKRTRDRARLEGGA